jgi:hypothetical protein
VQNLAETEMLWKHRPTGIWTAPCFFCFFIYLTGLIPKWVKPIAEGGTLWGMSSVYLPAVGNFQLPYMFLSVYQSWMTDGELDKIKG